MYVSWGLDGIVEEAAMVEVLSPSFHVDNRCVECIGDGVSGGGCGGGWVFGYEYSEERSHGQQC